MFWFIQVMFPLGSDLQQRLTTKRKINEYKLHRWQYVNVCKGCSNQKVYKFMPILSCAMTKLTNSLIHGLFLLFLSVIVVAVIFKMLNLFHWVRVWNVREVKLSCCQYHISFPLSKAEVWELVWKREHAQLGCQLKCLLTNKTCLISIHSCKCECLEARSCKHGMTLPLCRIRPPTEWKSKMT